MVILTICHAGQSKNIDIVRGERDKFTNVSGCNVANAVCSDESCADCQCMMDQTFVWTRGQYGKCVSNELMVYATSYKGSFLIQNNLDKSCIYQKFLDYSAFVIGSPTCNAKNWDSRWMWTNFGQLLNWKTLECMTDDFISDKYQYFPVMRKCNRNNQRQLWECVGDKKYNIMQLLSRRYMYYGEVVHFVTTKKIQSYETKWRRFDSKKDVCSQAVGCEIFADGSSLVILNKTKCEEQSDCLGEKRIRLSETKCFLLPNKIQYLHNDTWKALEIMNGSFVMSSSVHKMSLKWNLTRTPKSWKGILVQVQFQCESSTGTAKDTTTEHCVVIKYTGTFTGFNYNEEDRTINADIPRMPDGDGENGKDDGNDLNNDQEGNSAGKDNTKIIIIIICALVLFCIAGMVGIIVYKRRKRSVRSKNRNTENPVPDENSSPVVEEMAESANPQNNNSQPTPNQIQLYTIPNPGHEYEYVDANDRTFALRPQSPKYEIPQSPTYEYPEKPQSHQYEYPSLQREADTTEKYTDTGVMDSGYSPLVRSPVNNNESDDRGYTHLNNVQRGKEEAGATEMTDKPDGLLNAMDGEYTPLVRPSLKNKCEDSSYAHLINGKKTSDEGGRERGRMK
ncbi:Hypothetical predicted protein [Paramuricea clavata]|uniref:Uncharacterized protein n=1 Tax=Paramuricea clavata TaxID=317549 RepID=A0A7D9LCP5_PARCT|nr:Hypothetical predicted protein [Paramuricea clavata]